MATKGRAIGYSDYYKNNDQSPDDEMEQREKGYSLNISMSMPKMNQMRKMQKDEGMEDKRKQALMRMLKKRRAGK